MWSWPNFAPAARRSERHPSRYHTTKLNGDFHGQGRPRKNQTGVDEKIKLESTAGTGHFYTTSKNKRTTPTKLEFKKYDPVVRKHVLYKEIKLK